MQRREFLARTGGLVGALGLAPVSSWAERSGPLADLPVYVFSKHLQALGYAATGEAAAEMGFDGVDLTVRRGGHVEPSKVRKNLPEAVRRIREAGMAVETMSTDVLHPEDPHNREVLEVARDQGIRHFRVGSRRYDLSQSVPKQFTDWKENLAALASVTREMRMLAAVQNHSRFYLSCLTWDLWEGIRELPPDAMACHYDPCHAVVEAAVSWEVGFHLLKPRISALVIKDFVHTRTRDGIRRRFVPLGTGMVPWDVFWPLVRKAGLRVPLILHMEYGDEEDAEKNKALLLRDRQTLQTMLADGGGSD